MLPEMGGRIHAIQDKTNGYDLIYNQHVIKPALVGLAGPSASGGIEFNWPQHHRPATFLPVDYEIEKHPHRSVTIWCSDHDPLPRIFGNDLLVGVVAEKLGQMAKGNKILREPLAYANKLAKTSAKRDYVATSLPTMLLFDDDLQFPQETTAMFLQAQAQYGLGRAVPA